MSDNHECPKIGCPAVLPFGTLACKAHWFAIPPALRSRISKHWRDGDLAAYMEARSEAVAILNGEAIS